MTRLMDACCTGLRSFANVIDFRGDRDAADARYFCVAALEVIAGCDAGA